MENRHSGWRNETQYINSKNYWKHETHKMKNTYSSCSWLFMSRTNKWTTTVLQAQEIELHTDNNNNKIKQNTQTLIKSIFISVQQKFSIQLMLCLYSFYFSVALTNHIMINRIHSKLCAILFSSSACCCCIFETVIFHFWIFVMRSPALAVLALFTL